MPVLQFSAAFPDVKIKSHEKQLKTRSKNKTSQVNAGCPAKGSDGKQILLLPMRQRGCYIKEPRT